MERMARDKRTEDEKNQKTLSLFHQLYPESENRSKKIIMRRYLEDMQEIINDFVHSAGVGRPILELDRVKKPRGCREGGSQNYPLINWKIESREGKWILLYRC